MNEKNETLSLGRPEVPKGRFKCNFCKECLGGGCIGELPGMGGVEKSSNFIKNCHDWKKLYKKIAADPNKNGLLHLHCDIHEKLGIAPVTGAVQNIGFENEKDFYLPYFWCAAETGISICVGDGYPDEKLELGIQACKTLGKKAYFFFKPYPDEILEKRIAMAKPYAIAMGMDIDAYNIVTMRNQVNLEQKTAEQLEWFRKKSGLPLIIKGVFSEKDLQLCDQVHPDIAVVSNHGGRVDTVAGSTAEFLYEHAARLKEICTELWVDGGIRTANDLKIACCLGASKVLVARPFISSLCQNGIDGMLEKIRSFE